MADIGTRACILVIYEKIANELHSVWKSLFEKFHFSQHQSVLTRKHNLIYVSFIDVNLTNEFLWKSWEFKLDLQPTTVLSFGK